MKLLVDMNLSPRWIALLTRSGFEAVHWSTVGNHNARDTEIMSWAAANAYIVLTHDLDFSAILAATQGAGPSVVQIRTEDVSPDVIGVRVAKALHQMKSELEAGALLSLDTKTTRLRLLPLINRKEDPK
jgi:predicted nuclease of predicted toxin-antitoxin system